MFLFWTDPDAEAFVRKTLNEGGEGMYFELVESRVPVTEYEDMKRNVKDEEAIRSEFFGATVDECRTWTKANADRYGMIEGTYLAIVDKNSVRLNAVSLQIWVDAEWPTSYGHFGIIPRDGGDKWYTFRLPADKAVYMYAQLTCFNGSQADLDIPFFGFVKELTDENGVFDMDKAQEIGLGNCPEYLDPADPDMVPDEEKRFLAEYQ